MTFREFIRAVHDRLVVVEGGSVYQKQVIEQPTIVPYTARAIAAEALRQGIVNDEWQKIVDAVEQIMSENDEAK